MLSHLTPKQNRIHTISKLSLSHRSSLYFSFIDPLSICRSRFSLRAIFSKEDSFHSSTSPTQGKRAFQSKPISASTSRRARGMSRGLGVRGLVGKHGKLPVYIASEYSTPIGKHASKLACQIGVQVRTNLSTMNVYRWKNVDSGQKEAIIQNVADQFDLQGDSTLVNKTLNTKCGRLLSSHSNKLSTKYKKLVEKEGKTYARNHPPPNVTQEKWIELIDGKWSDKDWLEVSKRNAAIRNRTVSKHIHKCGLKSLAVRVDEEKNGGHIPKLAKVYHDTHFDSQKNKWVHPDCENTYQEMLSVQDEHCSTFDAELLTEEEISMIVLKSKFGYVRDLA